MLPFRALQVRQRTVGRSAPPSRFLLVLAGLLAAAALAAQNLEAALARANYSTEEQRVLREEIQDAEQLGIPSSLLLPRVEEGIAKRAPADRLLEALRRHVGLLLQARALLADTPAGPALLADAATWARAANLLAGGLPAEEVSLLARYCARRPGDYRSATSLYVALLDWGLERGRAQEVVRSLLDSRLPGEGFPVVTEILVEGRQQRLGPDELLRRVLAQLPQAANAEELKRKVLR